MRDEIEVAPDPNYEAVCVSFHNDPSILETCEEEMAVFI